MEKELKTYWMDFIKAWKDSYTNWTDTVYVKCMFEEKNFEITKKDIEGKSIKYYEKYKTDFQIQLEFAYDLHETYLYEYKRINMAFYCCRSGKNLEIEATLKYNEFYFDTPLYSGGRGTYYMFYEDRGDGGYVYNLRSLLSASRKPHFIINEGDEEMLPCVLGKAYYCSYLYKKIKELEESQKKTKPHKSKQSPEIKPTPKTFAEIFTVDDWRKYIDVLCEDEINLLKKAGKGYNYIGRMRKDKGVICGWISTLQGKKIISADISRQNLASVLNAEILKFDLGADGRTFHLTSKEYDNNYKETLLKKMDLQAN